MSHVGNEEKKYSLINIDNVVNFSINILSLSIIINV